MSRQVWKGSTLLNPEPPVLVSCGAPEKPNLIAFLVTLLVLQNLLAVLKLPDLLHDFFALVLFRFRLGGVVFVHIAFSFGGFIQPRLI